MKLKLLLSSMLIMAVSTYANAEVATTATDYAETIKQIRELVSKTPRAKTYNETFNPRQKEYPNHLGFNDLHIQAIRHLRPDTDDVHDPKLQVIVHHHCKAYEDSTFICLMFHTGMKDQDKPMGFEYIIPTEQYNALPEAEKKYWHYHKVEVPRAHATFPDLTAEEGAKLMPAINETYGKVIYFKKPEDKLPIGEPYVMIVQDMPEQD